MRPRCIRPQGGDAGLAAVIWMLVRPGGWVLVRQLNFVLDIALVGEGLDWQVEEGQALGGSLRRGGRGYGPSGVWNWRSI